MNHKLRLKYRYKRFMSKALSLLLCAALLAGGLVSYDTTVYAETPEVVFDATDVSGSDTTVSDVSGNVTSEPEVIFGEVVEDDVVEPEVTGDDVSGCDELIEAALAVELPVADVSGNEEPEVETPAPVLVTSNTDGAYTDFTTNEVVANLDFGTGKAVTAASTYSSATGQGFSNIEYNTEAVGWSGGVYNPRVPSADHVSGASYVTNGDGYLQIASKVWTESTTQYDYTTAYNYENTSSFDMALANADYKVAVTFVNPTDAAYTAYVESEDVTKKSDIAVAAGGTATAEFTACLVDGVLNLKFLVGSSATSLEDAVAQNVYVSNVKITRLATEEAGIKPTIFLASDSTVQTYEEGDYPKTGWGQTLHMFFGEFVEERECEDCDFSQSQTYETANVIVENRALGGRSSKSYVEEGKLDDILEDIKPGDYLFIQWGHNDATNSRPARYVAPTDFENWIQIYIDGALQRGATPVLVTPVARYSYSEEVGAFVGNFENYGNVMREMATEQDLAIVDLTQRSVALCNQFGIEGAKSLFMVYAGDSTHLQYYGAYKFAQCVAVGIKESGHASVADLATKVSYFIPESVPAQVNGLKTTAVGASSVSLAWDAVEGAELYYIYRKAVGVDVSAGDVSGNDAIFTETDSNYSVSTTNTALDSGCESGVTYIYAIRAFNEKGLGVFSDTIEVATKSAGWKFDINTTYGNSPQYTEDGWTGVTDSELYSKDKGYGWITAPGSGRDRGEQLENDAYNLMTRDCSLGAGEFALDLPNGDYEVTCYGGDLTSNSTQKTGYLAEGVSIGSISAKLTVTSTTGTVRVTDGQLNIAIVPGGSLLYFNGFTVTEIQKAPSNLQYAELDIDETTGAAEYIISFVGVDEATSYNVYSKNSTDTKYNFVKNISLESYAQGPNVYGIMNGDAGELYSVYVTAVLADGSETAWCTPISVKTAKEGPQAAAPKNLVCTDPTADETELQKSISLQWDAVDGAIKYIIYRSTRLEGEKGYTGFEKVGESKTTTFTDKDGEGNELATNINYYYKVAALTVTGVGLESDVCKTPITGEMVKSAREKYTDRALVAINLAGADGGEEVVTATDAEGNEYASGVYVSWRSYEADLDADNNVTTTFDVYRGETLIADDVKVTNLVDPQGTANDTYKVVGSNDEALGVTAKDTAVWANKYLELNLYAPAEATMPDGTTCTYEANDMSVADLDGDGVLELIVKWYPSNAKDNSGSGYTGKTYLDGYDVDFATGATKLMWRIDMGVNIRSGAHYTQFQVWDFDGDGKAEVAVKTADGTTTYKSADGTLEGLEMTSYVGACDTSALPEATVSEANDYRNDSGYVLDGPEYFSIFNGEDGTKAAADVEYLPGRGNVSAWGDAYGNRVDRFLSATAYLNGETPFAVFCRGYYTRTCLTAYYMKDTNADNIGDTIQVYWEFDTDVAGTQYEAEGNHGLSVNDVDNDGRDEIIYGALVIDNNGEVLYSTGLGHGDAMHVSDWVSWNEGLEIMSVHEHVEEAYHVEVRDAETGEILMGYNTGQDTGRGVAADIDPTAEGAEWWSIASPTYESNDEPAWDSTNGEVYSSWSTLENLIKLSSVTPASNASIFWDGDLLSEIQDHTFDKTAYAPTGVRIYKWDYENEEQDILLDSKQIWSTNGTKGNLGLIADILGDWREEIIARTKADRNVVRIYSTTIETDYVVPCLLENLAYREGVAWQNVGYNQPANLSYLLSEGLVTAQLYEGKVTAKSAEVLFTPANDGDLFGHDITAYKVLRAAVVDGVVGEFETVATVGVDDLVKKEVIKEEVPGEDDEPKPDPDPVWLKFDFGAGTVQEGWTQVVSTDEFSAEKGYGFTVTTNNQDKSYAGAITGDYADVYNDAVLAWTTDATGFDVVVPNGTYDVTYYVYNGSGHIYNQVTIEGTALTDIRRGSSSKVAETQTVQVEVTDGVLNIVNTGSKSGYNGLYFNGIEIKDVTYDAWYKAWYESWLEETKPVKYQYDFGAGTVQEGWTQVVSTDEFSAEKGYGFTVTTNNQDKSYAGAITGDYADVYNDAVLAWTTDATGFDVVVPNGTYDVTYYVYNGSGHIYNQVTIEGTALTDIRRGSSSKVAETQTVQVEVADGVLNIVNTGSKSGYNGLYFNGIEIVPEGYDEAYAAWYKLYCDWYGIVDEEDVSGGDVSGGDVSGGDVEEEVTPVWLKFDFGAGATQEGWTAVGATAAYSEEVGYGFTDTSANSDKSYTTWDGDANAALYNDCVLGWIANGSLGFDVKVPNGTYEVTYYIANGSGAVYDAVTAEGVAFTDVRRGNSDIQATYETKTVEVTDGVMNFVNTVSKSGYAALYYTAIEIKDVTYDAWYEEWLEESKPVKYQFDFGAGATQEGWTAVGATAAYSEEVGYGFTDTSANSDKSYTTWDGDANAALYNDCVLGWIANGSLGFDVKVPNGTYEVTYYIANGSGAVYDAVTAEGVAFTDVRRGNSDIQATYETKTVEVTDGVMNFVNTVSKSGYAALYFTGIEIVPEGYDEAYAEWYKLYCDWYGIITPDVSDGDADVSGNDASGNDVVTETVSFVANASNDNIFTKILSFFTTTSSTDVSGGDADVSGGNADVSGGNAEEEVDDTKVDLDIDADWVYSYTDKTVEGNTEYVYKIVAVADGEDSHMSRGLTVKTAVAIEEVLTITLEPLVEKTPLAEGQTVADLLPATVQVVDDKGNTIDCDVIWDASAVDINTVGTYKVIASFKATSLTVETTVEVIPYALAGVAALEPVKSVQGSDPTAVLPATVNVEYTNTITDECAVTWDVSSVNVNLLGEYEVEGVVTGYEDQVKAKITVVVVPNYIVSVENVALEVEIGSKKVDLPATVTATWANGLVTERTVTWSGKDQIDTYVNGTVELTGTVPGYDGVVTALVTVAYPVVYKFDFGVVDSPVAEGWTGVIVNKRINSNPDNGDVWLGGTLDEIGGTVYNKELGYGFLDGTVKTDGRWEKFVVENADLPAEVYQDFALPAGQTFVVDLENGKYQVSALSNSVYKSDIIVTAEGVYFTAANTAGSYTWGTVDTEVTDGQMTIYFNTGRTSRMGAIVIRKIVEFNEDGTVSGGDATVSGGDVQVKDETGLKVVLANPDETYVYTGSAIKPEIIVTNNGEVLTAGVDYTVKYSNNTNASTWKTDKDGNKVLKKGATITVTGKGNLTGSASTTFVIAQKDISDGDVISGTVVVAKGSKASPVLTYNNKKLGSKDYTNVNAKTKYNEDGTMTVTGKGNFTGTRLIDVKVVEKKELKKFVVTVDTKNPIYYDGEEHDAPIIVTDKADKNKEHPLVEGKDYIVVYGSSKVNAGTVKFTVIGMGEYSGTVAKTFKIKPMVVKEEGYFFSFGVDEEYTYKSTGVTLSDSLMIMTSDGETLVEGVDYKISYSNNKAVSTWKKNKTTGEYYVSKPAKYTVTFLGNYKGSTSLKGTFVINPDSLTDLTDGLQIKLADQVYTGKANYYKSTPFVTINDVTLKSSNYTVTYYTDEEMTQKVSSKNKVKVADGEDYATVYVKIVGKGNYKPVDVDTDYATAEYKVWRAKANEIYDMSKAKVVFWDDEADKKITKVTYTGELCEPSIKVTYKIGKETIELIEGVDYEVTYVNNLNKGTATAIITGTGDKFVGSKTAKFTITAQSLMSLKDLLSNLF